MTEKNQRIRGGPGLLAGAPKKFNISIPNAFEPSMVRKIALHIELLNMRKKKQIIELKIMALNTPELQCPECHLCA